MKINLTALFLLQLLPLTTHACDSNSTLLLARQNASFNQQGDAWTEDFSITGNSPQTLVLRFASVYKATAIIINANNAATFRNGGSVSYYKGFENNIGTTSVNLTAGNYALAIRNNNNGENEYSVELDCDKTFADATRVDSQSQAKMVSANGGKLWQALDVYDDYRLWVDGANVGLETYVIPENQLNAFQAGNSFNYYTDFGSVISGGQPGGYEIKLPEGRYYLAFNNPEKVAMPVTYTLELFARNNSNGGNGNTGGLAFEGQSSFSIINGKLTAEIERLTNSQSTTSQPLRLLWLASTDNSLSNSYSIAEFDLDEFSNSNGTLAGGTSFTGLSITTNYQEPPYGNYLITLALVSTNNPTQLLDSITYPSRIELGEKSTTPNSSNSSSSKPASNSNAGNDSSSGGGGAINLLILLCLVLFHFLRNSTNKKH